jgi:hypothetical protein
MRLEHKKKLQYGGYAPLELLVREPILSVPSSIVVVQGQCNTDSIGKDYSRHFSTQIEMNGWLSQNHIEFPTNSEDYAFVEGLAALIVEASTYGRRAVIKSVTYTHSAPDKGPVATICAALYR